MVTLLLQALTVVHVLVASQFLVTAHRGMAVPDEALWPHVTPGSCLITPTHFPCLVHLSFRHV
ncbi:hypothetical protein E2C01_099999 [Portunus trituberculatus]|uniref:Secreted protein n=1 Tax=Portunus trituberculatus TaxID=210409 RepID=A0A5B7KGT9_PORTR|nr:hypothetical protein [Portunus trituberculatus]